MPDSRFEIEVDARVHAALAEVAVHRAAIAVSLHQRPQLAEIGAEQFGANGGVLPAFPSVRLAGNEDASPERGLANLPDALGFCRE